MLKNNINQLSKSTAYKETCNEANVNDLSLNYENYMFYKTKPTKL